MGVYIKGMEMPKSCWECPMVGGYELSDEVKAIYSTLHCRLLKCKTPSGVKPNDCPLVPVPPHGDLIDADKLVELCDIMADKCDGIGASIWHQFKTTVEWSPIVIPAEEGE